MGLRPSYKQTEVGVIPSDWRVATIKELASIKTGKRNTEDRVDDGAYPFFVRSQIVERINSYSFDGEAVLTAGDGVGTGKVFHYIQGRFDFHQRVYRISDFSPELSGFFFFLYFSNHFYDRIMSMTAKSSVDSVRLEMIADMAIPLPSPLEQRAIAGALGDVEALIGTADRLIAKKHDLKQAAMQQLLTGQVRLPGFSGKREVKRLGEIAQIVSGGTPRTSVPALWDGGVKWCTPTDITGTAGKYLSDTERTISQAGLASCSAQLLPAGSLLLCSRATIGELKIAACELCTNQGFKSLIAEKGVNNEFLYYLLLTMKPQMVERAIGSTFLEISKKGTASLEVSLPLLNEQTAIAAVLSDMDAELAALEQRLAKTRDLKQGMKQELLTGRTRLV